MAVTQDTASESHTGTVGSTSEASYTWNHGGAASGVKGVLIFTFVFNATTAAASAVTYGGTNVPAVVGGLAVDTANEPGSCKAWFLGASVPQGTQAVVVTRTNDVSIQYAVAATVLAATDTEPFGVVLLQENQAAAEQNVDDGSPGTNSFRYAGGYSGLGTEAAFATGANSGSLASFDPGAFVSRVVNELTGGQGSRPVGFTAVTDDLAAVHLAVREIVAAVTMPPRPIVVKFAATRAASY